MPLVDQVDPLARRIGAVNMIVVEADGTSVRIQHRCLRLRASLRDAKPDWRADAGPVVVLGAGGAARAVVASLAEEGAREIRLLNRTRSARSTSKAPSARR